MKIGIISDTHDHLANTEEILQRLEQEPISYLIHAGDIGQKVLDLLATKPYKTIAVYGNTDTALHNDAPDRVLLHKQPYYFKIGSTTFKLMHQPYFLTPDSDIVIYGHLHRFACEKNRALFINPGEVCAREKPRIEGALLDLDRRSVTYLYKESEWSTQEVCP